MEVSQEALCGPLRHLHVGFWTSISDSVSILLKLLVMGLGIAHDNYAPRQLSILSFVCVALSATWLPLSVGYPRCIQLCATPYRGLMGIHVGLTMNQNALDH
jgi:hypothetical protein